MALYYAGLNLALTCNRTQVRSFFFSIQLYMPTTQHHKFLHLKESVVDLEEIHSRNQRHTLGLLPRICSLLCFGSTCRLAPLKEPNPCGVTWCNYYVKKRHVPFLPQYRLKTLEHGFHAMWNPRYHLLCENTFLSKSQGERQSTWNTTRMQRMIHLSPFTMAFSMISHMLFRWWDSIGCCFPRKVVIGELLLFAKRLSWWMHMAPTWWSSWFITSFVVTASPAKNIV